MKRAATSTPTRAADEPATVKAPRTRPPLTDEERDVEEYLERFELGKKKKGGSGKHHTPDRELIASLRAAASQRSGRQAEQGARMASPNAFSASSVRGPQNASGS